MMVVIVTAMMVIRAAHPGTRTLESHVLARGGLAGGMHGAPMRVCLRASMPTEAVTGGRAAERGTARAGGRAAAAHSSATEMAAASAMTAATTASAMTAAAPATGVTAAAARSGGTGTSRASGARGACCKNRPRRDQRGSDDDKLY